MRSFPEQRFNRYDALVALLVLLLAAALFFGQLAAHRNDGALTAVIVCDGTTVEELSLSALGGEGTHRTIASCGVTLRARFTADGVFVEQSDCPTNDCVHTGVIRRAGQSIVCLPGRISITLVGASTDYDMIAG